MTNDDTKKVKNKGMPRPLEWMAYVAAGLTSGIFGLISTVRTEFHEKLKEMPYFRKLFSDHAKELEGINQTQINAVDTAKLSAKDYAAKIKKVKNEFETLIDDKVESELKIYGGGFKGHTVGTFQRLGTFGGYGSTSVAIKALTATAIGAAGTMMFFNSLNTHRKLEQLKENTKQDVG